MNKTPLLEFVYNRKKTATKNSEAAVELRITFERKQKYVVSGWWLQWFRFGPLEWIWRMLTYGNYFKLYPK